MKALPLRAAAVALSTFSLSMFVGACVAPPDDDVCTDDVNEMTGADRRVLALGDSMTFAWDPMVETNPARVDPTRYRGYAELLGERLGAQTDNAACPGETSSHFISATGEDNNCASNRAQYELHVDWGTAPTQLDYVRDYLRTKKPVLITMTIGGNDMIRVIENCKLPIGIREACIAARMPFYERAYGENLKTILRAIHAAGYRGKMAFLTTYAPDFSDALQTFAVRRFNDEIRESVAEVRDEIAGMDVRVADGYAAFEAIASKHDGKTCETGLVLENPDGTCDIHPSKEGHRVLAEAILEAIR